MVLFLAVNDWANVSYTFAESLKSINIDAIALKSKKHSLQYTNEAQVYSNIDQLNAAVTKCNTIIWMHSKFIRIAPELLKDKKHPFS